MKNSRPRHILLLAALVPAAAWAADADTFYFTDAAVMPGETTNIELCLKNSAADLTCLEAEIELPEGLSVVLGEDGAPILTLYRNRTPAHEVLSNVLADGHLKLLVSSASGDPIGGEEGPILSFRVQADDTALAGEYAIETVGESLMVSTAAEAAYSVGAAGKVLITDGDDPTSIQNPRFKDPADNDIYNLAGQRLAQRRRGINIVGGRKELHSITPER